MSHDAPTYTGIRFRKLFLAEAVDLIASMERALLQLMDDCPPEEVLKSIFRTAHTLKGNAGMIGYTTAAAILHTIENIYQELSTHTRNLTPELLQNLLEATDCLRELLDGDPTDPIPPRVQTILANLAGSEPGPAGLAKTPIRNLTDQTYRITWSPAHDCLSRGADPIRCLASLREITKVHQIRADWLKVSRIDHLHPEHSYLTWQVTLSTTLQAADLREWFHLFGPQDHLNIEKKHEPGQNPQTPNQQAAPNPTAAYLRVPKKKLDHLNNLVTRIRKGQNEATSLVSATIHSGDLVRLLERLDRDSSLLQKEIQNLRQIELHEIFHRLPRLVHDLSIQLGKLIRIRMEGGEHRVDRSQAEELSNALNHLVRNCADHGIEAPPQRVREGKPVHGLITIKAFVTTRSTMIEVSDDGRGLQQENIRQRALAMGLIKETDQLDSEQMIQLIFHPGLSTAGALTTNSGRGIGMDAIRAGLQSIHGTIHITNKPGQGCAFQIALPASSLSAVAPQLQLA